MKNLLLLSICFILSSAAFSQQNYAFDLSANRNSSIAISNSTDVAGQWTVEFWIYKKTSTTYSSVLSSFSYKIDLETYGTSQKVGITKSGSFDAAFPSGYVVPALLNFAGNCQKRNEGFYTYVKSKINIKNASLCSKYAKSEALLFLK